jgi:hypothetical protein
MKKVFSHENRLIVFNLKNVLQDAGIACVVENEFASGGVGDLSPFETWPELWVVNDEDKVRALDVIARVQSAGDEPEWFCARCGERNPGSFQVCWNCGAARHPD